MKQGNFIEICSESFFLKDFFIKSTLNPSTSHNIKENNLQNFVDSAHHSFQIEDKELLKQLYLNYGENAQFLLKTGHKLAKNIPIGEIDGSRILSSEVLFEINLLQLNSPFDYVMRRHNNINFIHRSSFREISKLLTLFASELEYTREKYQEELFRLLGLKYGLSKVSL